MAAKKDLQEAFDYFNTKYFNDRLFDVEVIWSKNTRLQSHGETLSGYCKEPYSTFQPQKIVISKKHKQSTWIWKLVLLHEMVHLDLFIRGIHDDEHGPEFNNEMLRLAKAGALDNIW